MTSHPLTVTEALPRLRMAGTIVVETLIRRMAGIDR
jgi:hypothetical protein